MDPIKYFTKKGSSGLIFKPDTRDRKLDLDVLGAAPAEIKPLGRLEKVLDSPLSKNIIYQGSVLSCVHCSMAFVNSYNSYFNNQNEVPLSWPYTYAQVKHFAGGTSVNESLDVLGEKGQCTDEKLPGRVYAKKGEKAAQNAIITPEMEAEAINFQIDSYYKVAGNREDLYRTLIHAPVLIGLYVGDGWDEQIIYPKNPRFGHLCILLDIDANGNYVTLQWWNENKFDIRILHKTYPIFIGYVIKDKADTLFIKKLTQPTMKFIKADGPDIFLLDCDNRANYIGPGIASLKKFGESAETKLEYVTQEVLDSYVKGPSFDVRADNLWSVAEFLVKSKYRDNFGLAVQKVMEAVDRGEDPMELMK